MTQKRILSIAGVGILVIVATASCNRGPQPVSVMTPGATPVTESAPINAYPPANNYTTVEEPAYGMRPPVRYPLNSLMPNNPIPSNRILSSLMPMLSGLMTPSGHMTPSGQLRSDGHIIPAALIPTVLMRSGGPGW
jgi:hypothetical protein